MKVSILSLALAAAFALPLHAGDVDEDPNYIYSATNAVVSPGEDLTVTVTIGVDTTAGDDLTGFQWGLCHDDAVATLTSDDIVNGADLDTADDSELIFFESTQVTAEGDAWTTGVLIEAGEVLASGDYPAVKEATYTIESCEDGDSTTLEFCTAGSPPTTTEVVVGGDTRIVPTQEDGNIECDEVEPVFIYRLRGADDEVVAIGFDPDSLEILDAVLEVELTMEQEDNGATGFPNPTQGFQVGISHDATILTGNDSEPIGVLADLDDGDGPAFFGAEFIETDENGGPGYTVGVVYDLMSQLTIEFENEEEVIGLTYDVIAIPEVAGLGDMNPLSLLEFVDTIGNPEIINAVVVGGDGFGVQTPPDAGGTPGLTIEFVGVETTPFIRGDCNLDERVDIADGIRLLDILFRDFMPANDCDEACNANGDGMVDQSDAIYTFNWRFLEGPEPPAPFPDCDVTEDQEEEDCEANPACE